MGDPAADEVPGLLRSFGKSADIPNWRDRGFLRAIRDAGKVARRIATMAEFPKAIRCKRAVRKLVLVLKE